MILIANPLYDVVFKYLLEDRESAVILLSNILGEEILELELRPQEQVVEVAERSLTVFRLDFSAHIKTGPDTSKLVILEIQKAKLVTDIMRFRRYLGKQYLNKDNVFRTSGRELQALPIVSIYFLAYDLGTLSPPVIRVKRSYQDVRTQETLEQQHPFIESLTHDAFIVQLSKLQEPYQSELEKLLSIFDQHNRTEDGRGLKLDETQYPVAFRRLKDRLLRAIAEEKLLSIFDQHNRTEDGRGLKLDETRYPVAFRRLKDRLLRAIAEEKLRDQMDVEEDVLEELERLEREVEERDKQLEERDKKLEATSQQLEERDKKLEEQDKKLEEQDKKLEEQDKKLDHLLNTLAGTSQQLEEKDKKLEEQDKKLEEQDKKLEATSKQLEEKDRRLEDLHTMLNAQQSMLQQQARLLEELRQSIQKS